MNTNTVFISWTAYSRRSESVARALGAKAFYIEIGKRFPIFLLPVRYLLQAVHTWRILRRERPAVVINMSPPPFLTLLTYVYCRLHGARFAIDAHTGALIGRRWARLGVLNRFLSRRALTTIVTNRVLADKVIAWGASAFILELEIPDFPPPRESWTSTPGSVVIINSFSSDEPLEEICQAAAAVPDCIFHVTGRIPPGRRAALFRKRPDNVDYTDYLSDTDYLELLYRAQAVMVLVNVDYTLLQGAVEAVAVEKPLITSDWPTLRSYFGAGVRYVDNRPESIARAVRDVMCDRDADRRTAHRLKETLNSRWERRVRELEVLLHQDEYRGSSAREHLAGVQEGARA